MESFRTLKIEFYEFMGALSIQEIMQNPELIREAERITRLFSETSERFGNWKTSS